MRTAVVSDIHGNLPALEAVVAEAEARGCAAFLNLGDIVSGPLWPRETADYLMARNWVTIAGNHERQLLTHGPEWIGASDRYAKAALDDRHLKWLATLSSTHELSPEVFLCHGTPASDVIYFMESVDEAGLRPARLDEVVGRAGTRTERLILCGHTHLPRIVRLRDGRTVANPGSVGLPAYEDDKPFTHVVETGSPHARYGILEGTDFTLIEVGYDYESAATRADRNGRPDWAVALRNGRMKS